MFCLATETFRHSTCSIPRRYHLAVCVVSYARKCKHPLRQPPHDPEVFPASMATSHVAKQCNVVVCVFTCCPGSHLLAAQQRRFWRCQGPEKRSSVWRAECVRRVTIYFDCCRTCCFIAFGYSYYGLVLKHRVLPVSSKNSNGGRAHPQHAPCRQGRQWEAKHHPPQSPLDTCRACGGGVQTFAGAYPDFLGPIHRYKSILMRFCRREMTQERRRD